MFIERMSSWTKSTWSNGVKFVNHKKNKGRAIFGIVTCAILVGGTAGGYAYQNNLATFYHVSVDGKEIGVVNNPKMIQKWLGDKLTAEKKKYPELALGFTKHISITKQKHYKYKSDSVEKVINKLASDVHIQANAARLVVNGKTIAYARDEKTIDQALFQLKASYNEKRQTQNLTAAAGSAAAIQIKNAKPDLPRITIKENIQVGEKAIAPGKVVSGAQLINILKKEAQEQKVTVVSRQETVETQVIPYPVQQKSDPTKYRGDDKTIVEGKNGNKQVVYELVKENGRLLQKNPVYQKVLLQPVTKVVVHGTKPKPSRGDGHFVMPSAGIFSSPFGMRWGRLHAGIDIATPVGTPVHSADNGRVIFVGTKSGYGNCMIVDHGNGYSTLYGHLSRFVKQPGDIVVKGEIIAESGNTGRSTGPHLHFEIHKEGEAVNPLPYLR
jgi:murein DD-endopeptidase MepM/ murein hydrolase activator NlpD